MLLEGGSMRRGMGIVVAVAAIGLLVGGTAASWRNQARARAATPEALPGGGATLRRAAGSGRAPARPRRKRFRRWWQPSPPRHSCLRRWTVLAARECWW